MTWAALALILLDALWLVLAWRVSPRHAWRGVAVVMAGTQALFVVHTALAPVVPMFHRPGVILTGLLWHGVVLPLSLLSVALPWAWRGAWRRRVR